MRRNGKLLGSWSLDEGDIDACVIDAESGEEVFTFTARRSGAEVEERPVYRIDGDDFTMPLPDDLNDLASAQPTLLRSRPVPERRERPGAIPGLMRNGLMGMDPSLNLPGRLTGDDLTMPFPDITETSELPPDLSSVLEPIPSDDSAMFDEDPPTDNSDLMGGVPLTKLDHQAIGSALGRTGRRVVQSKRDAHKATKSSTSTRKAAGGREGAPLRARGPEAEVWVRKKGSWEEAGRLRVGQSVTTMGGWVRLTPDGGLSVWSGPQMAGSATLLDGTSIEVSESPDPIVLPPGASLLLRSRNHGLYVRTD
ncbi:MAG: hypothetical protein QF464_21645, partial [Myxococcota bacterium]|nr:hypothetical protein [Myxococcota bacterium]